MTLPTFYISHGGGPWPFMTGRMRDIHATLESALRDMPRQLPAPPKAILVISAHWEEPNFTVMGNAHPGMLYDYGGFPASTYSVRYAAPGSPELAQRVQTLVNAAGLPSGIDSERGFDHGMFAPMSVIYPDASLPVVQLSMQHRYHPAAHIALGCALAPLRDEGVLIIGSGLSFHNMALFGGGAHASSKQFDDWLGNTLLNTTGAERATLLEHWADAPSARMAHPQEDHLLPLMVATGAAYADRATRVYHEDSFLGGAVVSSYRFDSAANV